MVYSYIYNNKEKKWSGLNLCSSYFLNFDKKKYCLIKNSLRIDKYINELNNKIMWLTSIKTFKWPAA